MRLDHLACPIVAGQLCPARPCPGTADPGVCSHLEALYTWRKLSTREQAAKLGSPAPAVDPLVRDAVNSCPSRGPILPISMQEDCGCRGKELSECRESRGTIPGRVTLRDCLACRESVRV
jgi:hypothetical protein